MSKTPSVSFAYAVLLHRHDVGYLVFLIFVQYVDIKHYLFSFYLVEWSSLFSIFVLRNLRGKSIARKGGNHMLSGNYMKVRLVSISLICLLNYRMWASNSLMRTGFVNYFLYYFCVIERYQESGEDKNQARYIW